MLLLGRHRTHRNTGYCAWRCAIVASAHPRCCGCLSPPDLVDHLRRGPRCLSAHIQRATQHRAVVLSIRWSCPRAMATPFRAMTAWSHSNRQSTRPIDAARCAVTPFAVVPFICANVCPSQRPAHALHRWLIATPALHPSRA